MTVDQPIPFMLADPADEVDHGEDRVDSTYQECCHSIGGHAQGGLEAAMAALTCAHDAAILSAAPPKMFKRVMVAINSIADALEDMAVK